LAIQGYILLADNFDIARLAGKFVKADSARRCAASKIAFIVMCNAKVCTRLPSAGKDINMATESHEFGP
jgi:hypothetical protein